ncbi:MAG: hypothetical protein WAK12_11245 [Acidimicrobiales bacterium]
MAIPFRTSLHLFALTLLSGGLLISTSLLASASVSNPTTATILSAASKALEKQTSVRVHVSSVTAKVVSSVVADIGAKSGTETFTKGDESFTITVTPAYAYLSGTKEGLTEIMGLTAAEEKKVGTSAIAMKKGTAPYKTFKENLTVGALTKLLPVVKGTTLLAKRDKTTNGYDLSWVTAAAEDSPKTTTVMTISSGKTALPIKEKVTTSDGSSETTFSHWGEIVQVIVPSSTIPYGTVFPTT